MKSISELAMHIREFINSPKKQNALLRDIGRWNELCSCLDIIEDMELAIEAYKKSRYPNTDGDNYLLVFGILQALYVQEDAVSNLCEALKIKPIWDQHFNKIREIREIRNDSAGHPTKRVVITRNFM